MAIEVDLECEVLAVEKFIDLDDTPSDYTGQAGKFVKVNGTEDGVEFSDLNPITQTLLINPLVFDKNNDFDINVTSNIVLELAESGHSTGVTFSLYRFNITDTFNITFGESFPIELRLDTDFINSIETGKVNVISFIWSNDGLRRWSNQATNLVNAPYTPQDSLTSVEYWDFSESVDSTDVTLLGKKGNILTSNGETKPTLSGGLAVFNGTTDAMKLETTSIFAFMEASTREGQIHYAGELPSAVRSAAYQMFNVAVPAGGYMHLTSVGNDIYNNLKSDAAAQVSTITNNWETGMHLHSFTFANGLASYYYDGVMLVEDAAFDPAGNTAFMDGIAFGFTPSTSGYTPSSAADFVIDSSPVTNFQNNIDYLMTKNGL